MSAFKPRVIAWLGSKQVSGKLVVDLRQTRPSNNTTLEGLCTLAMSEGSTTSVIAPLRPHVGERNCFAGWAVTHWMVTPLDIPHDNDHLIKKIERR